ncbi:MAG: C39 family peptidase [Clostridia bacterium]|nr:C39 family peptidase [Clostridia bacterium]
MGYTIKFQSPASYSGDWYKYNTIGKSGCGPASVCNALKNAGIADVFVPTMCALAVSCGARVDGGTVMATLLNACKSKYGITYKTTSKNADLIAHLKAGGTAVCWCGGGYPLFSDSGHFVAAVGLDSSGLIYVADSLYYSGKWSYNSTRKSQIKTTNTTGLVRCTITALGKATADRSPSYYLISKASTTSKTTTTNTTTTTEKENEDDMTYYKLLTDVPPYYKTAIQKLVDSGAMVGTGNGELNISEDLCRMATVLNNAGILDLTAPVVYKTINDVPSYYKAAVQKMIDRGAIAGTGNEELNLSSDICRALTILDNAHILDAISAADIELDEVTEE